MATKTVINTNTPTKITTMRGISILIDQDQVAPAAVTITTTTTATTTTTTTTTTRQQPLIVTCQQDMLRPTTTNTTTPHRNTDSAKITIYQNTTTTKTQMAPTPSTAITRTVLTKLQPQPSKLMATTTTTHIGINGINNSDNYTHNNSHKHNDIVAAAAAAAAAADGIGDDDVLSAAAAATNGNNEPTHDERRSSIRISSGEYESEQQQKNTSYATIKQKITTSTAVPTLPHLLLKVVNDGERSGKVNNGEQTTTATATAAVVVNEVTNVSGNEVAGNLSLLVGGKLRAVTGGGQSEKQSNATTSKASPTTTKLSAVNDETQTKRGLMIIQCNGNVDHHHHHRSVDNDRADHAVHSDDIQQDKREHFEQVSSLVASNSYQKQQQQQHDDDDDDESCVTSAIGNGQNAFEHYICTNAPPSSGVRQNEHERLEAASAAAAAAVAGGGGGVCTADVQEHLESKDVNNANSNAIAAYSSSLLTATVTKAIDCASALTATGASVLKTNAQQLVTEKRENIPIANAKEPKLHVLKIQIKPSEVAESNEKQVTVVTLNESKVQENQQQQEIQSEQAKATNTNCLSQKIPVLSAKTTNIKTPTIEQKIVRVQQTTGESANELHSSAAINNNNNNVYINKQASEENVQKMVQKPVAMSFTATPPTAGTALSSTILNTGAAVTVSSSSPTASVATNLNVSSANGNGNAALNGINATNNGNGHANNAIATSNTSVTELNVTHPSYLYYVMSSGQFSPCDTLDSGTGSDLESNGNITPGAPTTTQNKLQSTLEKLNAAADAQTNATSATSKLEMHVKATKIRLNGSTKKSGLDLTNGNTKSSSHTNGDHARAGSFTDSEESESSSLSCDSLHSTEFIRQTSVSPTSAHKGATCAKMLGSFLPDSLLRDIRDRKFPTNDFESKYGDARSAGSADGGSDADGEADAPFTGPLTADMANEPNYINIEHTKFLKERNGNNIITVSNSHINKRASLPNKTFVLNADNGTFVDTKMNSMPRKYEADKYYNFHVREHENFRSFDLGCGGAGGAASLGGLGVGDLESLSEYETKSLHDDAFAGYKDIRCGSATSTIRSSKGTVRGVKNRVRNGIATFLQLQHPNVKNFKEKDAGKVVLYTTSMGIIRDTYAKCANVKQILRTLLVKFEERDVFMSIEYQQEIKERMHSEAIKVPQLFVEGQHIGDADTVERLNESGELRQLLKPYKSIATTFTCQTCGGYRLLPCPSCNGSKKSVHRNHFTAEFVALKCMNCDEVGLVKCHNC
ncbi:cell wall protein DAN4 [Ceratitis capitata]|uniref:cell wall protein DAN4 n=1 Tax=Ceratitis capitata TaxID=7213 RepID=UPI00061891ED|nr:cell wall protein DAN4 [Ceratitis capitata]XP_020716792.1 cell wall protein DAN4 [Ceratitis capitata]XP_020716793.1 cell wall protein DAN4 [Ceratitis capitata]